MMTFSISGQACSARGPQGMTVASATQLITALQKDRLTQSSIVIAAGLRDRRTLGCANILMLCYSYATPVISMMTVAIDSLPVNKSLRSSFRGTTRGSCMTCFEIWVHAAAQLRRSLELAAVSFPFW